MCGIFAILNAKSNVISDALNALTCLEYRGYDSAGMALLTEDQQLRCFYSLKGIDQLDKDITQAGIRAHLALGHTRWATHGQPALRNTHPIVCGPIVLVHNGIIENHAVLKQALHSVSDYVFYSETDTEVLAAWIAHDVATLSFTEAVVKSVQRLRGHFSFVVLHKETQELIAYAQGTSLVCHLDTECIEIASDPNAFATDVNHAFPLPEGTYLYISAAQEAHFFDAEQEPRTIPPSSYFSHHKTQPSKHGHDFFMHKEIHEQADILDKTQHTLLNYLAQLGDKDKALIQEATYLVIIACGSSYHAGLCARPWFEEHTGLLTQVDMASEFVYRPCLFPEQTLFITISQSGETYDTLQAIHRLKHHGYTRILGICNVPHTQMSRLCTLTIGTEAGPEISVASTKAFTTQLLCLYQLSLFIAKQPAHTPQNLAAQLRHILSEEEIMQRWAEELSQDEHIFFMGRGAYYAIALEGALKMKEISYKHAEAFPTGELKHGPLALLHHNAPVIFLLPEDERLDKSLSNLQEILSRGTRVFVLTSAQVARRLPKEIYALYAIHGTNEAELSPILYSIGLQLLAYHTAKVLGLDIDRPRNLAKSVTVE